MQRYVGRFYQIPKLKQYTIIDTSVWLGACAHATNLDGIGSRKGQLDNASYRPEELRKQINSAAIEGTLVVPRGVLDEFRDHLGFLQAKRNPADEPAIGHMKRLLGLMSMYLDTTKDETPDRAEIDHIETEMDRVKLHMTADSKPRNDMDRVARKLFGESVADKQSTYRKVVTHNRQNYDRYTELSYRIDQSEAGIKIAKSQLHQNKISNRDYQLAKMRLEREIAEINSEREQLTPKRWGDLDIIDTAKKLDAENLVTILTCDTDLEALAQFYKLLVTVSLYPRDFNVNAPGKEAAFSEFYEQLRLTKKAGRPDLARR